MGIIFGIYIVSCLPGLIVALLVRHWAKREKIDRPNRAFLVAIVMGLLCSPGLYGTSNGATVGILVIPSLLSAILAGGQFPKTWLLFLISSALTTAITFAVYMALSKPQKQEALQSDSLPR